MSKKPTSTTKASAPKKAAKSKMAQSPRSKKSGADAALKGVTRPSEAVIKDDGKGGPAKRKLGLRGAAPWAARHAAKHAAEARARAAEPAPPGSARATIRVPDDAEKIKAKISELHNQTQKIRTLRKRLEKGFFEIGQVLWEIQTQELYLAKGFGSFEAFLEREIRPGQADLAQADQDRPHVPAGRRARLRDGPALRRPLRARGRGGRPQAVDPVGAGLAAAPAAQAADADRRLVRFSFSMGGAEGPPQPPLPPVPLVRVARRACSSRRARGWWVLSSAWVA